MTNKSMAIRNREHRILGMIVQGIPYELIARVNGLSRSYIGHIAISHGMFRQGWERKKSKEAEPGKRLGL